MKSLFRTLSMLIAPAVLCTSQTALSQDFFVKATADFKGGPKVEFNCTRATGATNNAMKEMFQPSLGNKENSYTFECSDAERNFFSIFFKYTNSTPATDVAFKAFSGGGKLPLEKQFNVFTVRAKTSAKEMYIHSFPQLPQHYEGTPQFKVTSFAEEKDGANVYHVIAGEGSANFNATQMDGKSKNAEGTLAWSFKTRSKYIKSPR